MNLSQLVQEIQYILAPAVMISSSALLLLGFHTKFSNLAGRFRAVNHEWRQLKAKEEHSADDTIRLMSLENQKDFLFRRVFYVQKAILMNYGAIACFCGTSLMILLNLYTPLNLYVFIVCAFAAGLLLLLLTAGVMSLETMLFYRVMKLEKQ